MHKNKKERKPSNQMIQWPNDFLIGRPSSEDEVYQFFSPRPDFILRVRVRIRIFLSFESESGSGFYQACPCPDPDFTSCSKSIP